MQNKILLSDVVEIILGYTLRESVIKDPNGNISIVQVRDIVPSEFLDLNNLTKIKLDDEIKSKIFVQKNDVLFSAKGAFKACVSKTTDSNILATSSIYILRPKTDKIIPMFLAILLNSNQAQKYFSKLTSGATIQSLNKSVLSDFEFALPELQKQLKIIDLEIFRQNYLKALSNKLKLVNSTFSKITDRQLK